MTSTFESPASEDNGTPEPEAENIPNTNPSQLFSTNKSPHHRKQARINALQDITNVAINLSKKFGNADVEEELSTDDDTNPNEDHECIVLAGVAESNALDYLDEGDPTNVCKFCQAQMWFNERAKRDRGSITNGFSLCCLKGKVLLPPMHSPPQFIKDLFFNKTLPESKNFRSNIRAYNSMFSFTSMGGKIDHSKNKGGGPYTFILTGQNYHRIGSLLPIEGSRPVFSQLYIYDTENEVSNRISAVSNYQSQEGIDPVIVDKIRITLDEVNPFVKQYRLASAMIQSHLPYNMKLALLSKRDKDGRTYNVPTCSEVAALIVGDIDQAFHPRDIIVEELPGTVQRINELHPSYLPLQYPILFPLGEDGYRDDIYHREETLGTTKKKKTVSMREFFAYRLMMRDNEISTILHASRLLQQFIVDSYTMMESQRLHWIRTHQKELRGDLYQDLSDAILTGETQASSTGKRIILPSSFTGGARYMIQNYQDAMAICRWAGYPDLFITFTCNPAWPEIKRYCQKYNLSSTDRPDILCRVFKMKLQSLLKTIKDKKIFGTIRAEIYTVEFQKRGLPHAHILLFLQQNDKIKSPKEIDNIISSEIPDKDSSPLLYDLVGTYMMHGPCGHSNKKSPCMKDGKCSKYFPKKFNDKTIVDEDGYPTYKRRDDGRTIEKNGVPLDNRFVVPYNSYLLYKFQAHVNIEKTNQSTSIKYLFKYINKGNDRVIASLYSSSGEGGQSIIDEIKQYYDCRYVSSCEGCWRIFAFDIHHRYPSVERLSFHLPNEQYIVYSGDQDVSSLLNKPRVCESMFLAWMKCNQDKKDKFARSLTYGEFPQYYVWQRNNRLWKKREKGFAVGRIGHASPASGERYYLRILLTKVKGPRSYDEIKTVDNIVYPTFREACYARGLLDDDKEYIDAIKEASIWATGITLRKMFVSMLLCCCLSRPDIVWKESSKILSEDLFYIPHNDETYSSLQISQEDKEEAALKEIESLLQKLNYDKVALQDQSERLLQLLTDEQQEIFQCIIASTSSHVGNFFFVYGYGGTGKTFLWNALTTTLRSKGKIVLAVASSAIAATLLPSGRTAHSRFAIPIDINEDSVCNISQRSPLAYLLQQTELIIWDEAPMIRRHCIEAFDRSLKDIMHCDLPFGGKSIVMGGDFRQILPVIPKGSRADIVNASISSSYLWSYCKIYKLTKNMRLTSSSSSSDREKIEKFSQWLLDIGDGRVGESNDGIVDIEIPSEILITSYKDPLAAIVSSTYPDLLDNLSNTAYFNDRAILAPTLECVNQINEFMCGILPGESVEYFSCDSVCRSSQESDSFEDLYTTEFLNTINSSGLPPHKLTLKIGAPVMLLRNVDQASGLCNGTRLRITKLGNV
ncbi:uncharacterized protein LOC129300500 [Prosopis cineraria]|uniref:uncharacterized protein LOC129300500 n=1 Tax=Prosopis cineraria TaxID=364024 RepID=UPI0024106CD8|nr:uncharacterized protein LOC129300500 [Prosopis cineraria]